jgi:hypothetical protein
MTHDSRGKAGRKTKRQGSGPTLANHRAAEKGRVVQAPLIWVRQSRPSERCILDFGPPPLRLKVERQGGSGIQYTSLIWTRKFGPLELAHCLLQAHYRPQLRTNGFLTPSLQSNPLYKKYR